MSDVTEIAEVAADGVADGMHIVGEEVLAAEKVIRAFDGVRLAYLGLGLAIGGAIGAAVGFKIAFAKAETKYSEIADEEIASEVEAMRRHYAEKAVALENQVAKAPLETIIKERGYSSTEAPMAVTPPNAVVDAAREVEGEEKPDLRQEVYEDLPEVRNIFRDTPPVEDEWDWHKERSRRSPLRPYIIHIEEREGQDAYDEVTFTYFEADDVLCNERDEVVAVEDRDRMIGESHLNQFGHGSGDPCTVYIRNDQLEVDFEIVFSPNSYAQEVHGFEPPEPELKHAHRRRTFDDE